MTAGRAAPVLPAADALGPVQVPRLADGVELLGEYKDSGYSQPPSLVPAARRPGHPDVGRCCTGWPAGSTAPATRPRSPAGQRRPGPVPDRRSGPLSHHRQAAAARHHRRRGRPGRRADGQPAARARARGTLLSERAVERRRGAADAAVPVARRGGRARQPSRPWTGGCSPSTGWAAGPAGPARPGGPAHRARPDPGLGHVPRVRARGRLPLRRRAARQDRGRHLHGLARVLHQRHRLLPAVPGRAAAHRPRRPVLQRHLHAGPGGHLRGHLVRDPAPGHRRHAPGDAGAADAVRPLRRLLHPQSDLVGVPDLFARVVPILRSAAARESAGPARGRPAAPRPDRGDRLGGLRHPAARGRLRVTSCCTCPPSTGRCGTRRARRPTSWPPR